MPLSYMVRDMKRDLSRRSFLQQSAALSTAAWSIPRRAGSSLERLNLAIVGVAGRGAANLQAVSNQNIVALCDVDRNHLSAARERHPQADSYQDYRKLLERSDLDAVVISTPDHTHAVITAHAMKAGLDVYCEKPLTHSIWEARQLTALARQGARVTQMGTQVHAGANYRRVVEKIQSGLLGEIRECHVWVGKSWFADSKPEGKHQVPTHLNWDLWLGPVPSHPYHPKFHPANWRSYWPFGGGTLADMGCHYMDLPFWALDLRFPHKVSAQGPAVHAFGAPQWQIVTYEFAKRPKKGAPGEKASASWGPTKLIWYHGGKRPPQFSTQQLPSWGDGVLFVGTEGMLLSNYSQHVLLPEEKFRDVATPEPWIPSSIGHHKEWIEACKTRSATTCNFDYAGPLTETALLGNIAFRLGQSLDWEAEPMKVRSIDEAANLVRGPYRTGWAL